MNKLESFVLSLIIIKNDIINAFNNLREKVTNTTHVHVIRDGDAKPKSKLFSYYVIYFINAVIQRLKSIRTYLSPTNISKIQITKTFNNQQQSYIIDANKAHKSLSLNNIFDYEYNKNDNMSCVLFLFKIDDDVCLKEHIMKYKDNDELFHNTLENMVMFNGINVSEGSKVHVKIYANNRVQMKTHEYDDVKTKHLNFFTKN